LSNNSLSPKQKGLSPGGVRPGAKPEKKAAGVNTNKEKKYAPIKLPIMYV
jgi:hypothetical protein